MSRATVPGTRRFDHVGSNGPVVSARGVVKRYGNTVALAGLDAEIGPGITGLLGSNGAGKTTFISVMLGLRTRDEGELSVLGRDPSTAGIEVRARIGYAPEHHDLPAELAASDFVRHLAEMHLLPRRAAVQRANDALWLVGLGEERFRPVGTMSTGQRQRVKLASAISHDPELVLLDEPTDGLDPMQRISASVPQPMAYSRSTARSSRSRTDGPARQRTASVPSPEEPPYNRTLSKTICVAKDTRHSTVLG